MSKSLAPLLKHQFLDLNGDPLSGGFLYSYESNTTTPLATYTDFGGLTANTNPVVLDAGGFCNLWLGDTAYKFILHDANDVPLYTVDPVQSLAAQIATQISIAGALAATNNLSDLTDKPLSLVHLNIAPFSYQLSHAITNNQAATNLTAQTFDGTLVTSRFYAYEIVQGTTIMATGDFSCHYLNGTWVLYDGMSRGTAHGVTFTVSQATTIGQLKAAESGSGNGIIKLKRHDCFA